MSATLYYDDLVARCKRGELQSYEVLYRQYAKSMFNTSLRIVNNIPDAEDVLQESFAAAFHHLDRFDYSSTFGAWIKRIVVNHSINVLRRRKLTLVDIADSHLIDTDENEIPDEETIQLKVDEIRKTMAQLPNGFRTVLSLHLFEGYDYEEIAEILNISVSTVRTQYYRARQKLLRILKQDSDE